MPLSLNTKATGLLALLAANTIWGLYGPLCKDLLNASIVQPFTAAGLKIVGAALLFLLLTGVLRLVAPHHPQARERIARADWGKLVLASLLIIAGNQTAIILGLQWSSPIDGTILCGVTPFFTLLLGAVCFHERLSRQKLAGVALGFSGMVLMVLGGQADSAMHVSHPVLGNTLFLLSQVFGAVYLVFFSGLIQRYSAFTLMRGMFVVSAVAILPLALPGALSTEWHRLTGAMWMEVGYIIVCSGFLAYLLLLAGQKRVEPTVVASCNYLQPVVATVFSLCLGLSTLTIGTVVAAVLIFLGLGLILGRRKSRHTPAGS